MSFESIVLGVDIGGSHITAALVNLESRCILQNSCQRSEVDSKGTVNEILTTWSETMAAAAGTIEKQSLKVGIALPGPCDYNKGICLMEGNTKYEALYGLNIKDLLSQHLGVQAANIRLQNDAGSFLKGEVFAGAGQGFGRAIGVTLGTGLGTSRCINGVEEDADLWRMPFKESIAENYISTRWFLQRYAALSGRQVSNVKELADLYETEIKAKMVFEEFACNLAEFFLQFIKMDEPEVIIAGGNISNAAALFFPQIMNCFKKLNINVPVRKAILGEDAAILGSSSLWLNN